MATITMFWKILVKRTAQGTQRNELELPNATAEQTQMVLLTWQACFNLLLLFLFVYVKAL